MLRTSSPFLPNMLFAVAAPLLIVVATAFVVIPYSLGGHPGEARPAGTAATTYHPS